MNQLTISAPSIPRMSESAIEKVRELESKLLQEPQSDIVTRHVFHAGMYARTITIPAGVCLTGAYITIPTLLIVSGQAVAYADTEVIHIDGYSVLPASAGRKQAFLAITDTELTMIFTSSAQTVEQAEEEFTNEYESLMSRHPCAENIVTITGE